MAMGWAWVQASCLTAKLRLAQGKQNIGATCRKAQLDSRFFLALDSRMDIKILGSQKPLNKGPSVLGVQVSILLLWQIWDLFSCYALEWKCRFLHLHTKVCVTP